MALQGIRGQGGDGTAPRLLFAGRKNTRIASLKQSAIGMKLIPPSSERSGPPFFNLLHSFLAFFLESLMGNLAISLIGQTVIFSSTEYF